MPRYVFVECCLRTRVRSCAWIALARACFEPAQSLPCTATLSGHCWVYLGPENVHVTALSEVGGQLWIGTLDQGIFRYDGSQRRWNKLAFSGKYVASIVAMPSGDAVWATVSGAAFPDTTFSYVYLSRDNGRTWQPRDGGFAAQQRYYSTVGPFAVDPLNSNRLLLGPPGGRLALSEDGGVTWRQVLGPRDTTVASTLDYLALAFSPTSSRVWAGGSNIDLGEQLARRSDDTGRTWVDRSARTCGTRHGCCSTTPSGQPGSRLGVHLGVGPGNWRRWRDVESCVRTGPPRPV